MRHRHSAQRLRCIAWTNGSTLAMRNWFIRSAAARACRHPSDWLPQPAHPGLDCLRVRHRRSGARLRIRADRRPPVLRPHHPTSRQVLVRAGHNQTGPRAGPAAYDHMIGLQLHELSVDGCITKALYGGERAGRSPFDRGKQGLKRSVATEARGVPVGLVSAGANRHDSPLLVPTLETAKEQVGVFPERFNVNLDRATTATRPEPRSRNWASPARSPARACPHRSRLARGGSWSGATHG